MKNTIPAYDRLYNRLIKRLLDILISGVLLLLCAPLLLLISLAIYLESGRPVLYRAPRGGYRAHSFKICKFRSMVVGADKIGGSTTALHDSRITRVGNILRKTKMDELPQLFQVFTGKMSMIGPRPELLQYTSRYQGEEQLIFQVRPGITDYSSIEFVNLDEIVGGEDADAMYEKLVLKRKNELRVRYAKTVSFPTDVTIFFQTIAVVLNKAFGFIVKKEHR